MLNYGGCTLKTLGVGIVYVEYLFLNSSYSKKKKFLTQVVISSMVETKQQNRSKKRESNKGK